MTDMTTGEPTRPLLESTGTRRFRSQVASPESQSINLVFFSTPTSDLRDAYFLGPSLRFAIHLPTWHICAIAPLVITHLSMPQTRDATETILPSPRGKHCVSSLRYAESAPK